MFISIFPTTYQRYVLNSLKCGQILSSGTESVPVFIVEQIPWASFQGGGLRSTAFVAIYQNVRLGL